MEGMANFPDNYFDLAIVDPPYGAGDRYNFRYSDNPDKKTYENKRPGIIYFDEIQRVSKNQMIWGGNYFTDFLKVSSCWLCWNKGNPAKTFSDFELCWSSFDNISKLISLDSYGFNHADKRHGYNVNHPTQKPVALYRWILENYAKPGDKLLDTHVGSASSLIAFEMHGFDYVGYELEADYYRDAKERMKRFRQQPNFLNADYENKEVETLSFLDG